MAHAVDRSDDDEFDGLMGARRTRGTRVPTLLVKMLVPAIYLGCLLAFIADLTHDNTLAFGVAYVPLICTAVLHRNPRAVWWLAGIAIVMVCIGFFLPVVNSDVVDSVGNRVLSVMAILVAAALVRYSRGIQEQLVEQTARAEAGERLKTEVFTNLSHEIRTPLHAIIGFTELMMANCRPDQRLPLGQMRIGGKRLLGTIDNLIDLTHLDRHVLRAEPVDVAMSMRQAAEVARAAAATREVAIVVEMADATTLLATADPWAVRRILDNLLSNAVKFTNEGGSVVLSVERSAGGVIATVADSGIGMPAALLEELRAPLLPDDAAATAGSGLALSRRLALAMHGVLLFESAPGRGTTVRLCLPA